MPRSENQSECSIGGLEWVNESYWVLGYSKSDLAPLWVTKYPRCKDFESKVIKSKKSTIFLKLFNMHLWKSLRALKVDLNEWIVVMGVLEYPKSGRIYKINNTVGSQNIPKMNSFPYWWQTPCMVKILSKRRVKFGYFAINTSSMSVNHSYLVQVDWNE